MVKDIHVERLIIVEPLQGDHLVVPLRFIESFEVGLNLQFLSSLSVLQHLLECQDVHMVISMACQGTKGSAYIEQHHYDLDDEDTNAPVIPENLLTSIEDGKRLEVAILIQRRLEDGGICLRCGYQHKRGSVEQGWYRW